MSQTKHLLLLLLSFGFGSYLSAQEIFNPEFSIFKGTVYKIPAREVSKGYTPRVSSFEEIAQVEFELLDIPEQQDSILMPGVNRRDRFGIIFNAEMTIAQNGLYHFSLNSDDGSVLWINDKKVIHNDGLHKMTEVQDSIQLAKGRYPIRIWYFQGVADRYGLQFKASFLKASDSDSKIDPANPTHSKVFSFTAEDLNFDLNSFELDTSAESILDEVQQKLNGQVLHKITIVGYTDNQGTAQYNEQLSLKRAQSVKEALDRKLQLEVEYIVIGKGEQLPIASNNTVEGRELNRRVEIIIE